MGLEAYREKRRFDRTREPQGRKSRTRGLSFVVQMHDATRLHFDFRLELDGVLLSWAVPKGPSLDPHDKRLAMQVEDHPVEYGGFEGTIPAGEYGAGTVMVWDRGTWEPEGDPREGYQRGSLKFTLHGEKLRGRWHLVRTASDDRGRKRWLLFKGADDEARRGEPIVESAPASALTGRTLDEIAAEDDRPTSAPRFRPPELATLVKEPPEGDAWLHEIKLDGYRILAHLSRGKVTLFSRNGKDWTERMPTIASALGRVDAKSAVLDGEVVVLREDGVSDFQLLQNALGRSDAELTYFVFDLLERDGRDLRGEPLEARKAELARLVPKNGASARVRFNDHVVGHGKGFFASACKVGLEGVVSKRRDAPYREGRGRDWLKVKCLGRQEFVIVGWTDPRRSRAHFGALLLATRKDGHSLVYVGKVGTGFSEASLASIAPKLRALSRDTSPLARPPRERGVHWVEPKLVCEVDYQEMTRDGILRQPSFRGLRQDKPAEEIVVERSPGPRARARVSNEDKVFYPESGITKGQVAAYLERVSAWMLPHVAGRPLMLLRCPDGIGKCFIQKHTTPVLPRGVRAIDVGEDEKHVTIDDEAGLMALAQAGVLEIHTWGAHADAPDRPDLLVFDLDPDPSVAWRDVVAAARLLRVRLESLGLEAFVKTTGGKGLHVACAIAPTMTWDAAKSFARAVAQAVATEDPAHLIATMSMARRQGKIFVDYLRNGRGATFIAPYSPRARPFAPVAMPLSWDELTEDLGPDRFTIANASERLDALRADPWAKLGVRPRA
ncbi:MAG TPA: DNA ligase D [Polyangiaceae bacterium]|nr:DNA ligase D [Polyangiaceae bacterium]